MCDAESLQLPDGEGGFGARIENQGIGAAGKDDARARISARQLGGNGDALGRLVERDRIACRGNILRDHAAEHDNAVGRSA